MTVEDLIALRKRLKLTQAEMADRVGLSTRAYSGIEVGEAQLRPIHVLAAERVALSRSLELSDPMAAPASVRRDALRLASLFTE